MGGRNHHEFKVFIIKRNIDLLAAHSAVAPPFFAAKSTFLNHTVGGSGGQGCAPVINLCFFNSFCGLRPRWNNAGIIIVAIKNHAIAGNGRKRWALSIKLYLVLFRIIICVI